MSEAMIVWLAIGGMALGTLATRIGGFWLMRLVPEGGFVARSLHHLPGALVVSILAPYALEGGWSAPLAIAIALIVGRLGLSAIIAVFGAVGVVALLRFVLSSGSFPGF
jgi:uncharacterized membrane protein